MAEETKQSSTQERDAKVKRLLMLLLVVLVVAGIIYLGINIGWGVIVILSYFFAKVTGAA